MTTVWVSRPSSRAAGLVQALSDVGLVPHCQAALSIEDLSVAEVNAQIANNKYDIVILISAEAAKRFMDLRDVPFDALVTGAATAAVLRSATNANLCNLLCEPPAVGDSEQLLSLHILQAVNNCTILVVGGMGKKPIAPLLCAALQSRGAEVQTLALYQRTTPTLSKSEKESLQKINAATAYSGETAENMLAMVATLDKKAAQRIATLPLFVIHPNIVTTAQQCGWQNPQLAPADDMGMATAIRDYFI